MDFQQNQINGNKKSNCKKQTLFFHIHIKGCFGEEKNGREYLNTNNDTLAP